jgi:folate-binding protein YgfZ
MPDIAPDRACDATIDGHTAVVFRDDSTGEPGLEFLISPADAPAIYGRLIGAGARPAGWHAFNIARIEAGTPLYNIDFGPDSLPHETGVLHDRVSFKKGCYLGQEIVARMESRGHSKRSLVGVKCEVADPAAPAEQKPLPTAGAEVWRADAPDAAPVGVVTSSTLAPMLGWTPIGFAAVKPGSNTPGTALVVAADGERIQAAVQPGLIFWKR